jgi:putative lipoprotein
MKHYLLALTLMLSGAAHAAEDAWTGSDKTMHFALSAGTGLAAYAYTHSKPKAFGLAMIPGIVKEVADSQEQNNHFSGKDLAWDAVGAFAGIQLGDWSINNKGVSWGKSF